MKYITSITCITHNNSIDTEIYEMETTNHKLLFKLLSEKISKLNSTPQMLDRFKEILNSLNEQDILKSASYHNATRDCSMDSYSKYETVITKTEKSLTVELHRLIYELTNNSFIVNDLTITHSIILQILITN